MSEIELLLAHHPLSWAGAQRLLAMGVPLEFLGRLNGSGDIGQARVSVSPGGARFEFEGDEPRLLLAVRDELGHAVDLVALSSADEQSWALHCGESELLGGEFFEWGPAACGLVEAGEVRLFGTPMDWLRGAARGLCVLDWNRFALQALRCVGVSVTLLCDDTRAAERLREALRWGGLPRVRAAGRQERAAA